MPRSAWTGYGRFCPLARALDVVGERWTLVIVQELLKRSSRYSELARRLPGIGTNVLADRLRKLEAAGVVERIPGPVGEGVTYALTDRGTGLSDALEALRRWGVSYLTDPAADGSAPVTSSTCTTSRASTPCTTPSSDSSSTTSPRRCASPAAISTRPRESRPIRS